MYLAAIFLNGNSLIATANNYRPSQRIKYTIAEKGQACIFEMLEKRNMCWSQQGKKKAEQQREKCFVTLDFTALV